MKVYAIKSDEDRAIERIYGYLFYYEKEEKFHIEIPKDVDFWEAPMILDHFIADGSYCVGEYYSKKWVENRIIPPDRQLLGKILKANNLECYDEFRLLTLATGRCAQDHFYISPIKYADVSEEIKERMDRNISDVSFISEKKIWFTMKTGEIYEVECMGDTKQNPEKGSARDAKPNSESDCKWDSKLEMFRRLMAYYNLVTDAVISPAGNSLILGGNFEFTREDVFKYGHRLPVSMSTLKNYMADILINSEEAAAILDCSRQNIDDLVKRGKLTPIKSGANGNIFLRNDVLERRKNI